MARRGAQVVGLDLAPNQLAAAGFVLERALEPEPSDKQAERVPGNREIPTLLLIRAHLSDGQGAENRNRG